MENTTVNTVPVNSIKITAIPEDIGKINKMLAELNLHPQSSTLQSDGSMLYTLSLTDEEYDSLNSAMLRANLKQGVVKLLSGTAKAGIAVAEYGCKEVIAPTVKIGAITAFNAGRIALETGIIAGSGVVNALSREVDHTKENMANNEEYQQAKTSLKNAGKKMLNLFGIGSGGTTITKQ